MPDVLGYWWVDVGVFSRGMMLGLRRICFGDVIDFPPRAASGGARCLAEWASVSLP